MSTWPTVTSLTFAEALIYAHAYDRAIGTGELSPAAVALDAVERFRRDSGTSRHFTGDVNRRAAEMMGEFREFEPPTTTGERS